MKISVIIPTLNEEERIEGLVNFLLSNGGDNVCEVIVVDGGSNDSTIVEAEKANAKVIRSPKKGRAVQMNCGANASAGDVLYFVHADTRPPASFAEDIEKQVKNGVSIGCYRFRFDSPRFMLKINSYFTRFNGLMCRGGDQTLFVTKKIFEEFDGYNEDFRVMEEYEFLRRVRKEHSFKILPKEALVSARKYDNNSWMKVNVANLIAFTMFRLGSSQERIIKTYYRLLGQPTYKPEA